MPNFDFLLNLLVAALLAVTLGYCFVLERKLRALRTGQDGLKDVIESLDKATGRAQLSLVQLKEEGTQAGGVLKAQIDSAALLVDELKMMMETGDRLADRLAGTRKGEPPPLSLPAPDREAPRSPPDKDGLLDKLRQAR